METGRAYPDITFLPQLAAYFNISIDELMSYAPQLTKEEIKNYTTVCQPPLLPDPLTMSWENAVE